MKAPSWIKLAWIAGLTAAVIPLAGAFAVPTGPSSHVQLLGVIMFVLLAAICCWLFFRCPSHPRWRKSVALLLCLPAIYLAVDSAMTYLTFGINRRPPFVDAVRQ